MKLLPVSCSCSPGFGELKAQSSQNFSHAGKQPIGVVVQCGGHHVGYSWRRQYKPMWTNALHSIRCFVCPYICITWNAQVEFLPLVQHCCLRKCICQNCFIDCSVCAHYSLANICTINLDEWDWIWNHKHSNGLIISCVQSIITSWFEEKRVTEQSFYTEAYTFCKILRGTRKLGGRNFVEKWNLFIEHWNTQSQDNFSIFK